MLEAESSKIIGWAAIMPESPKAPKLKSLLAFQLPGFQASRAFK